MNEIEWRVKRADARVGPDAAQVTDRVPWDWYAESCPCDLRPGECRKHPRARQTQRPPEGNWRVWGYVAGRGAGKTRAGAGWIQRRVEQGTMKLGCLIAPTANDIRDVLVEGSSGLLNVAPPWMRPKFEPSKRRVSWPNGARAICLSGEEPECARGLNIDTIWADELACWQRAQSMWELVMLALRAGDNPQALITTTPRRVAVLKRILDEPTTVQTTDTTYANQAQLPVEFVTQIVSLYENTRLGRQEIYAEFLQTTEGVWFTNFAMRCRKGVWSSLACRGSMLRGFSEKSLARQNNHRLNRLGPPAVAVTGSARCRARGRGRRCECRSPRGQGTARPGY